MSLLLSLLPLLVLLRSCQSSPLISLLQGPISDSVCTARCRDLPTQPSQEQCSAVRKNMVPEGRTSGDGSEDEDL